MITNNGKKLLKLFLLCKEIGGTDLLSFARYYSEGKSYKKTASEKFKNYNGQEGYIIGNNQYSGRNAIYNMMTYWTTRYAERGSNSDIYYPMGLCFDLDDTEPDVDDYTLKSPFMSTGNALGTDGFYVMGNSFGGSYDVIEEYMNIDVDENGNTIIYLPFLIRNNYTEDRVLKGWGLFSGSVRLYDEPNKNYNDNVSTKIYSLLLERELFDEPITIKAQQSSVIVIKRKVVMS